MDEEAIARLRQEYDKRWRDKKRLRPVCKFKGCLVRISPRKEFCQKHIIQNARTDKISKGICVVCGTRPVREGILSCSKCSYQKILSKRVRMIRSIDPSQGLKWYDDKLLEQKGLCAICNSNLVKPYIDHDHLRGILRGLLCSNCNVGLGHFKDDPEHLKRASNYIEKYK